MHIDVYSYNESNRLYLRRYNSIMDLEREPFLYVRSKKYVVGIDPSSTGWAMTVMDTSGKIAYIVEFCNVKDDWTEFEDRLAKIIHIFISPIVENIVAAAQEEVILSKSFAASVKLNEVRVLTNQMFAKYFGKGFMSEEKNTSWKGAILPAHLRKKSVYKGSVAFINDILGTDIKSDNVTDSICIAMYILSKLNIDIYEYIDEMENITELPKDINYILTDNFNTLNGFDKKYTYNRNYSLLSNVYAMSLSNEVSATSVDIRDLTYTDIAKAVVLKTTNEVSTSLVLVVNL